MKRNLVFVFLLALTVTACQHEGAKKMKETVNTATEAVTDVGKDVMEKAEETGDAMMEKTGEVMEEGKEMMEEAGEKVMEIKEEADNAMESLSASYTDYSPEAGEGKKHILFFHAEWCGTCAKWEKKVQETLGTMADNVQILKIDYDSNPEMVKKYGVTKQSTAVFINADGTVFKKEGDPSLESIAAFFAE